jgi:hypothetical protein
MEEYYDILRGCGCSDGIMEHYKTFKTPDTLIKEWEGQLVYFTKHNVIVESQNMSIEVIEKLKEHKNKKRLNIINKVLGKE